METVFRLFFLAAVGLAVIWAGFFLVPSLAGRVRDWDDAWLLDAFPRGAEGRGDSGSGAFRLPVPPASEPRGERGALAEGGALVQRHLRIASGLAPFFGVFFAASLLAGLVARERLRLGNAYASPTCGFLAKRLVEGVSFVVILWVLAPVPAPAWAFYPLVLLGSAGGAVYAANLPLRL